MIGPPPRSPWMAVLLATAVAVLLRPDPWLLAVSLALGAAVLARRPALFGADEPGVDDIVERLQAAAAGDFACPPRDPWQPPAARQGAIDAAFAGLRRAVERANALADNDPVTNLPNRLHFRREGEARLARLAPGTPSALLFVDLDRFKAVNDSLGHAHGDMLLMQVASRLRDEVRDHAARTPDRMAPILGRLAGDEFTVLLPGSDRADALAVARSFGWSLRSPLSVGGRSVTVSASVGIAMAPDHGATVGALLRAADDAMYAAKDAGRGQACVFEDAMASRRRQVERLEAELAGALAAGDFQLVFQPQVQLSTGRTSVVEALLRWGPEGRPPVAAADFLAVAEDSGLIGPIGDWVADAVADRLVEWQRAGYRGRLAVNLSPRQLARPDTLSRLEGAVVSRGGRLAGLEVEIGETAMARAGTDVRASLAGLRARGVTVTVDDYGAGHSRLRDLAAWPVDRIKLDGALVRDLPHDPAARVVAEAAVDMIRRLGREPAAGGVEAADQLDILGALGVEAAQGYLIARPMTAGQLERWSYAGADSAAVAIAR